MMLQLPGLSFICVFAVIRLVPATVRKNTAGSAKDAAAAKWGPMDLGLGAAGDLPLPGEGASDSGMIDVPGEGQIPDEMVAVRKPTPLALQQERPLLSKAAKPSLLAKAQSQGLLVGASLDAGSDIEPPSQSTSSASAAPQARKVKVLEEYDVQNEDEDDDEYRTTPMQETKTAEQLDRVRSGDVEHVKPAEKKKAPLIKRLKLATASQQHSKVEVKEVEAEEQAPGNDKMMGQCMAFAGWVKSQGSTGPDLVRIWKGTCMPAVMAGNAPPAYSNMCNALGTAVSKFAVAPWAPADMCQAVLAVFRESGVGATPLR